MVEQWTMVRVRRTTLAALKALIKRHTTRGGRFVSPPWAAGERVTADRMIEHLVEQNEGSAERGRRKRQKGGSAQGKQVEDSSAEEVIDLGESRIVQRLKEYGDEQRVSHSADLRD